MATVTLEYDIAINNVNGTSVNFVDTSLNYGVGGNLNYSDIKIVRFYRGNYLDDINVQTLSGSGNMDIWREYQSQTLFPYTYDQKIVPVMGRFIPFIAGITVQTNSIMQSTGLFSPYIAPSTYLPLVTKNTLILYPSDFGLTNLIYPDRVYYGQYEVYIDTSPTTLANVTIGNTYIVYGTTGTCTYNASVYRIGEVFIATDNNAVSFTGGAVLKILAANRFKYFCFTYNIDKSISDLTIQALGVFRYEEIAFEISVIKDKLDGIKFSNIQNWTSAKLAQDTINNITQQLAVLTINFNA